MAKIGSPLFILKEACKADLFPVLDRLAAIGYDGVELQGLYGKQASDVRKKLDSLGMEVVCVNIPFGEFCAETGRWIDDCKEMGCKFVTVAAPPAEGMPDGEDYAKTIAELTRLGKAAKAAGMTLLYHNHGNEMKPATNGKSLLENIMDDTSPELLSLKPDLGWMQIAGADPMYYLKKYKHRCPIIHFKDYAPAENEKGFLFRPNGYGYVNHAALYETCLTTLDPQPEWYIMDHDNAYERDAYEDLAMCLDYFRNLMRVTGKEDIKC